MRQYQSHKITVKEAEKIFCNKCGREIRICKGVLQEDMLEVQKQWGYFSDKDNRTDCFDLCEQCYDAFVQSFVLPVEKKG